MDVIALQPRLPNSLFVASGIAFGALSTYLASLKRRADLLEHRADRWPVPPLEVNFLQVCPMIAEGLR